MKTTALYHGVISNKAPLIAITTCSWDGVCVMEVYTYSSYV